MKSDFPEGGREAFRALELEDRRRIVSQPVSGHCVANWVEGSLDDPDASVRAAAAKGSTLTKDIAAGTEPKRKTD